FQALFQRRSFESRRRLSSRGGFGLPMNKIGGTEILHEEKSTPREAETLVVLAPTAIFRFAITSLAYRTAERAELRRVHQALDFRADWRAASISQQLRDAEAAVTATAVYVASTASFTAEDFDRFVAGSNTSQRPIPALAWAPRVTAAE